ncbi:MAG: DUF4919 domain-containing protein [Chloroflexi bacterium]|nr:DUF4919 domain-containing protein [Chloroflexota bacterium]
MADNHFETLVEAAQKSPGETDYTVLRRAYVTSPHYQPTSHYSFQKLKGNTNQFQSLEEIEIFCKKALANNPMDLELRMMLEFVYEQMEQYDLAAQHHAFVAGMLDAIHRSGDGKSLATAWQVVAVAEEYTMLSVLGLKSKAQSLVEHNERYFDVLECVPRDDPEADVERIHFDITPAYLYLRRMIE